MNYETVKTANTKEAKTTLMRFYNEKENVYVTFTESDHMSFSFMKKDEMEFDQDIVIWKAIDDSYQCKDKMFEDCTPYIFKEATEFEKEVCEYCTSLVKKSNRKRKKINK